MSAADLGAKQGAGGPTDLPLPPDNPICPAHGLPVNLIMDPFMAGVWDKTEMVWLCPNCAQERSDNI